MDVDRGDAGRTRDTPPTAATGDVLDRTAMAAGASSHRARTEVTQG